MLDYDKEAQLLSITIFRKGGVYSWLVMNNFMSINEAVVFINDKYSLAHYALYRISIANLPTEPSENPGIVQYTEDALLRIRNFIQMCVQVWNDTHKEKLEPMEIFELFLEMRARDLKDIQKKALIPR
jgi:hypothetical protein